MNVTKQWIKKRAFKMETVIFPSLSYYCYIDLLTLENCGGKKSQTIPFHQGEIGNPGEQGEIGFKGDKVGHRCTCTMHMHVTDLCSPASTSTWNYLYCRTSLFLTFDADLFVCVWQGILGPPGVPGIRGKPGPQVSFGLMVCFLVTFGGRS